MTAKPPGAASTVPGPSMAMRASSGAPSRKIGVVTRSFIHGKRSDRPVARVCEFSNAYSRPLLDGSALARPTRAPERGPTTAVAPSVSETAEPSGTVSPDREPLFEPGREPSPPVWMTPDEPGRSEPDDPRVQLVDLLDRGAELGREVLVVGRADAARLVRVELEASPLDLDVARVVTELGKDALEPALADEAPRADDVGPDLDLHAPASVDWVGSTGRTPDGRQRSSVQLASAASSAARMTSPGAGTGAGGAG